MSQPSHRIIGVIRIETPVADISGGVEDDSTIGGLLARFAQRSLIADGSCPPWWFRGARRWSQTSIAPTAPKIHANLGRLLEDLKDEFEFLSDVVA
jgi:hypothetical protein